ncbi:hypothetical protein [Ancylobacter sp. FA202]|uniref:hypothetical protein n=1 Tax=Ancylobacter sp. FA202 TaxID=1111106 RepID=UPI00037F7598|nr:hypothetical protein [Ancylobacter sp. FA202]
MSVAPLTDGLLCGWRIRSAIALPELLEWQGDDRPPDLTVRLGDVDEHLPEGRTLSPFLEIDGTGTGLLQVPEVGRFLVRPSGGITIAPQPEASAAEIRLFLLGSVLGLVCHQRALLPLHASSVVIDGGAVAFCGPSGMGKSTLALRFARRGHAVVSDDVCVLDSGGPARVRPSFPRLKLWRDAIEDASLSPEGLERNRRGQEKYHFLEPEAGVRDSLPLRAIFLLRRPERGEVEGIERLSAPLDILAALEAETFRLPVGRALGTEKALFQARTLIASTVPVYQLRRQPDAPPERWLDAIAAIVRG